MNKTEYQRAPNKMKQQKKPYENGKQNVQYQQRPQQQDNIFHQFGRD
jgi:hypothetical protein